MPQVNVPAFGLCPFRSPVEVPEERRVFNPNQEAPAPRQALGQCLGLGCGLWCVSRADSQGKPLEGVCSWKLAALALDQIAMRLATRAPVMPIDPSESKPS